MMRNIIRAEFYRIFNNIDFAVAVLTFWFMTAWQILDMNGKGLYAPSASEVAILAIIFLVASVVVIAADFSCGTLKNALSGGLSRWKFFLSKYIVFAVFFIVTMFVQVFLPLIFGGISNSVLAEVYLPLYALIFAFCSVMMFLILVFRKISVVIATFWLITASASLNTALDFAVLRKYGLMSNIIFFSSIEFSRDVLTGSQIRHAVVLASVYTVVIAVGGFLLFRKAEIK
ncbi:MAG: ABC transporter permease [Oscillospiraceae bacterium]|nr:ABC transporter permease [Oscillospiraceae bacterium]